MDMMTEQEARKGPSSVSMDGKLAPLKSLRAVSETY